MSEIQIINIGKSFWFSNIGKSVNLHISENQISNICKCHIGMDM